MTMREGFRGNYLGLNIFVSNNISIGTASTQADTRNMAGYSGSITVAEQLMKIEALRQTSRFADEVRALLVYGAKVVRPDTLVCFRTDYTAEP